MKKRLLSTLLVAMLLVAMIPMAAQAVTNQGAVVGGWLRLRQSPSLQATVLTSYPTGTILTITGSTGEWYQVTGPDGRNGYVMAAYVNVSGGSSYNAYVISQNGKGVRLRSGPSTTYRVYAVYPVGTPVTVLQHGAYWDYVRIGYRTGYMMNEFLTTGSTPSTGGYYAFITSTNGYGVRLRAQPSQSANIMGVYSVGTRVYVITHDTYWDYIRVGTREGYMMNKFLIRSSDSGVTGVTVSPATATVAKGSAYDFTAAVSGTAVSQDVQWTISGTGLSAATSISSTGHLFVAANEAATTITVKATSIANSNYSATATVTVSGTAPVITDISVTAAGSASSVGKGATLQFSAVVNGTGTPSQEVTWSVSGAKDSGTSISSTGLLTVAAGETATSLNIIATSKGNTAVSGSKNVSVTEPATVNSVTVDAASADVAKGSTVQMTATVAGTNNPPQTVTWTLDGTYASGTTVSTAGLLTVDSAETASTVTVKATSTLDTTKSGTKAVTVKAAAATVSSVKVTTAGNVTSVDKNKTLQCSATVTGTNNPAQSVVWSLEGKQSSGTGIGLDGLLTVAADETAANLIVRATSTVDPSKTDAVTLAVNQPTVTGVTVSAAGGADAVAQGGTLQFSAVVDGMHGPAQGVTWSLDGTYATGTSIVDGLLTVDAAESKASVTVKATSTAKPSVSGTKSVSVTVTPAVTEVVVSAAGSADAVAQGGTLQFSAVVNGTGTPSQDVTWSLDGTYATGTSIVNGLLTVDAAESNGTITVKATSTAKPSVSGTKSVSVTVTPTVTEVVVSAAGGADAVAQGGTLQFSAVVNGTGTPSQGVTWSLEGTYAGGTVIVNGLLTVDAAESNGTITVKATSTAATSISGTKSVNVTLAP